VPKRQRRSRGRRASRATTCPWRHSTTSTSWSPRCARLAWPVRTAPRSCIEALEHDHAVAPEVDGPDGLKNIEEYFADEPDDPGPPFPFWNNFESKPLDFRKEWPPAEPLDPIARQWLRFREGDYSDAWINACRALVLIDVQSWPAASKPHAYKQQPIYGPSLDLYVALHRSTPTEWFLMDGYSPVGEGGLLGWTGRLWDENRQLIASGGGQLICKTMRT
jgi:acyl-CoA thioesterase-2